MSSIIANATASASSHAASASATHKVAAQSLLDPQHGSPVAVNTADPFVLFVIQATLIVVLANVLGLFLKKLRQPRVIAEVIGGLILGPSAMGRVPGFTEHIFPPASIPYLNLVATIGLVLFLFLVGLETNFTVLKHNKRQAITISAVGLLIPFGLGCAVAKGVYDKFVDRREVSFAHFLLFVAVAMSITAFPVLARILTELRLLSDQVGVVVLGAGVGNDVVGWILLALSVALVNASSGLTALYVLLTAVGYILFLFFIVKPIYMWLLRKSGSLESPTQAMMALTLLIVFASAWFTDVIGIHAIFGGFLAGLIVPHGGGYATAVAMKIEDLVDTIFLPLYFVLSGLKTNLGLLNNGSIWGWVWCVIFTAFFSKFLGCAAAAKFSGFPLRESLAVGSLMSCKGLVELIVLNIGLQAGILNNEVFAMFVLMALVTTIATTPLTMAFYPMWYRQQRARELAGGVSGVPELSYENAATARKDRFKTRFVVALERVEHLPPAMVLAKLFQQPANKSTASITSIDEKAPIEDEKAKAVERPTGLTVEALHLVELTERTSSLFVAADVEESLPNDPVCNIFTAFARLNNINVSPKLAVVPHDSFASTVATHASRQAADMVLVPLTLSPGTFNQQDGKKVEPAHNPFESIFGHSSNPAPASPYTASYIRKLFTEASSVDVGLFLDRGFSNMASGGCHIFFPFVGGQDDRAALALVVQLCMSPEVTATVLRITRTAEDSDETASGTTTPLEKEAPAILSQYTVSGGGAGHLDTVYGNQDTQTRLQSDTADEVALAEFFPSQSGSSSDNRTESIRAAIARITFSSIKTSKPLSTIVDSAAATTSDGKPILVVAGRGRRGGGDSHQAELAGLLKTRVAEGGSMNSLGVAASSATRAALGGVGSGIIATPTAGAGLLLIQAAEPGSKNKGV